MPTFLDFSFLHGAPVEGTRLTACGRLTLSSTNTERAGIVSFRNRPAGPAAVVRFAFDRPIHQFELTVSHVRADERLSGFNVESPTKLSGTLVETADGQVTTSRPQPADDGAGTLTWPELETREISFAIGGAAGSVVSVDRFAVAYRP